MSEHDENHEEVVLKVIDRRKFNPDGSLKDGVELEPRKAETPVEEIVKDQSGEMRRSTEHELTAEDMIGSAAFEDSLDDTGLGDEDEELPGVDDPASFINFLSTLATNAAAALGAVPHPATGKRSLDLEMGKHWLDVLSMLKEKTSGNLHPQEERLIDGLLADLRMQYVTMVRATEEKLKADAAKKFSGDELLGRK